MDALYQLSYRSQKNYLQNYTISPPNDKQIKKAPPPIQIQFKHKRGRCKSTGAKSCSVRAQPQKKNLEISDTIKHNPCSFTTDPFAPTLIKFKLERRERKKNRRGKNSKNQFFKKLSKPTIFIF